MKGILTKKTGVELKDNLSAIGSDVLQTSLWKESYYFVLFHDGTGWKYCEEYQYNDKTCVDYEGSTAAQSLSDATSANITDVAGIFTANGTDSQRVSIFEYSDPTWQDIVPGADSSVLDTTKAYRVNIEKMLYLAYVDNAIKECSPSSTDFNNDPWNPVNGSNKSTICTVTYEWTDLAQDWGDYSYYFWTNGGTQYIANIDGSEGEGGSTGLLSLIKESTEVVTSSIEGDLYKVDRDGNKEEGVIYTFDSTLQLKSGGEVVKEWTDGIIDENGNYYTWEYSTYGDWDVMTTLTYASDPGIKGVAVNNEVVFDEPLVFDSVSAKNVDGEDVTLGNLRYDGYLMGLPDVWSMLEENRNSDAQAGLKPSQKARIVNIPAGTELTGNDDATYKIKPSYGVRLLDGVSVASCTENGVTIPEGLDLSNIVTFEDPELKDQPEISEVSVIEGEFVDEL